jgi:DNA-binding transcriptional LysR family regulator
MSINPSGLEADARPSLRELEILRAMIRSGKTVAAARALGISQPAVSRALASLETKFAKPLFVRDGARLVPTAEALRLDYDAEQVIDAFSRLSPGLRHQSFGPIRVAGSPTMAEFLLPSAVERLRGQVPTATISVEIGTGAEVLASVADRRADLGIVDWPVAHPALRAEIFFTERAHVILPDGHRLLACETISASDLVDEPMVALARRFPSRSQFDAAFVAIGAAPRIVAEVSTSAFAVQLVRSGLGVTILNPFPLWLGGLRGLHVRPFEPGVIYQSRLITPMTGAQHPLARQLADIVQDLARSCRGTA